VQTVSAYGIVFLSLIIANPATSQSTSIPEERKGHRFSYSGDNFSITLPETWVEVDSKVLAAGPESIKKRAPNAGNVVIKYGFKPKGDAIFPWVGVIVSADQLSDEMFANLSDAYPTLDIYMRHLLDPSAGGTIQSAQMSNLFYDKAHHVLWGMSQSSFSDIGNLQTLSAAYVTRVGTVQVHCYSKASEYSKYQPTFRRIVDSVEIDPRVTLTPKR
jgi:hypothetical protein